MHNEEAKEVWLDTHVKIEHSLQREIEKLQSEIHELEDWLIAKNDKVFKLEGDIKNLDY